MLVASLAAELIASDLAVAIAEALALTARPFVKYKFVVPSLVASVLKVMLAEPSKLAPLIVRAVANLVAVAELPAAAVLIAADCAAATLAVASAAAVAIASALAVAIAVPRAVASAATLVVASVAAALVAAA